MARQRQGQGAPRSLWERAGARAGDGAGALFARLDAQDAQDALDTRETRETREASAAQVTQARERAAATLERLAARVRAGEWSDELAALVARAARLSDG
jgi:hypothetical protein